MTTEDDVMQAGTAAVYLEEMQDLARELKAAMQAIVAGELQHLQRSVARQEMLCASLGGRLRVRSAKAGKADAKPAVSGIDREIGEAALGLHQLNLQYGALLQHSGKSIAMLVSLCRTHQGSFCEDRGARLKQQTWCCEM